MHRTTLLALAVGAGALAAGCGGGLMLFAAAPALRQSRAPDTTRVFGRVETAAGY